MKNGEFSKGVVIALSKRAGSHCSLCKKLTSIPHRNPEKFHNLGEAAHIVGQKNAPNLRFDSNYNFKQLSSASNGIWLCQACHHIIDNDEITYTVEVLNKLKEDHDKLIISLFESGNRLAPILGSRQMEIEALKLLIKSKEMLIDEKEQLYSTEINQLKFKLAALETEQSFLSDQLTKIKTEIIDLNHPELVSAMLEGGDIDIALAILDEKRLEDSQIKIGKARLLKARLYLSKGDNFNALENFEHALRLWPSFHVAYEYIKVLYYQNLNFQAAIRVAKTVLSIEDNPRLIIELKGHLAQAELKSGLFQDAHNSLQSALKLFNVLENPQGTLHLIQGARLEKHLGDCCKYLGDLPEALKCYERSLNYYFQATFKGDEHGTTNEFAGLATAIGLLYEQNNDEVEGLVHHLRAKEVLKDTKDEDNTRALIYLNIASCYLKRKNFNLLEAKTYVTSAIKILKEVSIKNPTYNLEYLSGAMCQLADIYQMLNPKYCTKYYTKAMDMAMMLCNINSIYKQQVSHVKHNYAVYLITSKKDVQTGFAMLDEGIESLKSAPEGVVNLEEQISKALFFKLNFVSDKNQALYILNQIIEANKDIGSMNKSYLYKVKAEQILTQINGTSG